MSLNYDKVKRLKVLDNLVIAKGKNKIILINPNTKRHITVKTDEKKDIVDVHITEESEPKKYEPVLRQKWNETKKQLIELLKNESFGKSGAFSLLRFNENIFEQVSLRLRVVCPKFPYKNKIIEHLFLNRKRQMW
ncbi:unnamed protein product, partial [marine sediment metagenome]